MKHIVISLIALFCIGHADAQVAHWLVPPEYDWIDIPSGCNVVISKKGGIYTLWSLDGKLLENVEGHLSSYHDGHAIALKPRENTITAIYDSNGNKSHVKNNGMQLGTADSCFHSNYLLVTKDTYYYYMDTGGTILPHPFVNAYPFSNDYATCYTYENLEKMKNPYWSLLDKQLKPTPMLWEDKPIKPKDLDFVSSVNDEGIAIVAAKQKLFYFHAGSSKLSPVLPLPAETNVRKQARYANDISECFETINDTTYMLRATCGKSFVYIYFDSRTLIPVSLSYDSEKRTFKRIVPTATVESSPLRATQSSVGSKVALYKGGEEILPEQFDKIQHCIGERAIVSMNGKYGLIRVTNDDHFSLKLNDNNAIAFRHKDFNTTIRLDMPPYIDPSQTRIEVATGTGFEIDKVSKVTKRGTEGNCIIYDCVIDCPPDISDDLKPISYPISVVYEGLRTPRMSVWGKAWHSKYYNVNINDEDITINGDTIAFIINIDADRLPNEDIYSYTPSLITDSLDYTIDKESDSRYKCKVINVREGKNSIIVRIKEFGCPPADYAFDLEYVKATTPNTPSNETAGRKKKRISVKPKLYI